MLFVATADLFVPQVGTGLGAVLAKERWATTESERADLVPGSGGWFAFAYHVMFQRQRPLAVGTRANSRCC